MMNPASTGASGIVPPPRTPFRPNIAASTSSAERIVVARKNTQASVAHRKVSRRLSHTHDGVNPFLRATTCTAWTFVFWGLLWGVFQAVHVVARKKGFTPSWVWLNRLLTFLAATLAWVFFRATSMRSALDVLAAMFGLKGVRGGGTMPLAPVLAGFIIGGLLWVNFLPNTWEIKPQPEHERVAQLGLRLDLPG